MERAVATAAVVAAVGAAACAGGTSERQDETPARPVEAALARVEAVGWPAIVEAGGIVRARQVAVVSSRVLAPVEAVLVKAGDRVTRGQTLVRLDDRELAARAAGASAAVAAAARALEAARAHRQAAEAARALARATHDRVRALHDRKSATPQELDQAVAALAAADAQLAGAGARVAEAEAQATTARAGEDAAAAGASYATLHAPFDGLVAARHVDAGSLAAPGTPLVTVEDTSAYRLEVRVDEARASLVARGTAAEVRLDRGEAGGEGWAPAAVAEVESVDPSRHSFVVKFDLPRSSGLRSGVFGRARVAGPSARVLAVPAAAIVRRGQLTLAFAVDAEGVARLRLVSLGREREGRVEVVAGLAEGDRVVVAPPATLADGTSIGAASGGGRR